MSRLSIRHPLKPQSPRTQQQRTAARRRNRRLFLESLEQRSLLATMTWDGSSSVNWTDAANWAGDIAPTAGDDLFFPAGAANLTNNNDFPAGTSFNTILFMGGGYNITGNAISLAGGLTANNTTGNNSFTPAITLGNALTLMSANAGTTLTLSSIDTGIIQGETNIFGTSALTLDGSGTLVITGVIAGQGSIEKLGAGTATLRGNNTYTGLTDVRQGFLRIESGGALGPAGSAETQIQAGAQLQVAGTFTVPEHLALREAGVGFGNGSDPSAMGALRALSGTSTWTGNMDLAGGNNIIGADSGATIIASGLIQNAIASANRLLKVGGGTLRLSGTQANVYRGDTVVLQGTLELGKTAGLNAIGGNLVIGDNISGDNAATVRLLANNQIPHIDLLGLGLLTTTLNSSGVLDFNGFSDTIGNLTLTMGSTYSADVDLNGGTMTLGGSTLTVNGFQGSSGVSPATTLADGTFDLGTLFSGAGGGAFKALNVNDTQLNNVAPDLILSANITGTSDIGWNKGGGGTLVLSGNNTNSGPVTLGGGIVGIGSNAAFGTGLLAFQSSTIRAFGANRTVSNTLSLDNTIPVLGDLDIAFTGPATLTGDRTIQVMDPDAIVTFAAPIGDGIFGSRTLAKSGRGTLQLTAANTFSGTYTINNDGGTTVLSGAGSLQNILNINVGLGGILRLDNTGTNGGDRINDVTNIALNGELALVGNATANTTEVTGPVNTGDQVASTITVQNTSGGANSVVLVGNALGINGTRLINFRALGGGGDVSATGQNRIVFQNSPGNLSNGILVASRVTTASGIELATLSNAPEGVAIVPVPATAYTSDLTNAGTLSNVRITTPGTYTLTRSKQINSLIIGPGVTIDGADVLLNVTSGIFDFVGAGASAINVESINTSNGSFFVGPGMTTTIGGNIVSGNVHKGGSGKLILTGDSTFSGNLTINEGIVNLQRSTAAGSPAGGTFVRQGGTLELQQTTFGAVDVGLEPLTLHGVGVGSTVQYVDAVGAIHNIAGNNKWAGTVSLQGDATDLTGPLLLNGFPVIANGNTFFNVDTGSRLTITGAINNGVEVIKRGPGTLEYAGVIANTYDATTRILEGTLELNKDRGINSLINQVNIGSDRAGAPAATLRLITSDQMRDDRGAFIHSSGLLDIGQTEGFGGALVLVVAPNGAGDITIGGAGTLTTNVDLNVFTQGTGSPTGATITGGTVALQYQGIVAAAGSRNWQVNDGATGNDLTVTSAIVDGTGLQSVGINKNGFGTLEFGGTTANTFTGTMSHNEGILLLNKGTGTGGVNAIGGPLLVGDANVQSGFASSDIVRLLQANQIPDLLAAIDVRNTGLFDLNNNNETIGNVDVQNALTINGGATISTGTGILTINGDVTGNPAQGAALFTPVAVATINGKLNLGTGPTRTFNIGNRSELPVELIVTADISGTAGINLQGGMGMLLNGNNTFSGDTYRSNGDWAVGSDTAFGAAKVYMNGGHIVTYNGPRTIPNEFVYSGATISYLGGNGFAGSGAIGGGGNNLTFTGIANVTGGSYLPTTAIAGILEFAGGIGETMNTVFMRKQGAGTMILSSTITLSGGFEVGQDPGGNSRHMGGTVVLRGAGTYFNSNITIGTGGVFQLDNSTGNLTDRLGDSALIDLFGGTLALVSGSGVQVTESIGQLRGRNTFTGTVQSLTSPAPGTNAVWRFTNLGLEGGNQGTAVKFQGRGQNISNTGTSRIAFNTAPTLTDGIIPFGVMQGSGGYDFATTINVGGVVTPFDNFLAPLTSGANFGTSLATATATVNVKLSASEAVAGPITANAVLMANGGIVISGAGSLTVDSGLIISNGAANQISVISLVQGVGEGLVFVTDNSDLNISSGISGAASSFAKNGRGSLTLSNNANANTYAGTARVTEGTLRVSKDSAFGTNAGNVSVTLGALLELTGGITIPAEQLTLAGQGEANLSIPLRNVSGTNTWLGNVVLNTGRTAIDVVAGQLNIGDAANPGVVSNQGFNKFGAGVLQLAGNASNTNNAQSNIWQGTVELNKSGGTFAAINAIIVGDLTNGGDNVDVLRWLQDNQLGDTNNYTVTVQPSGLLDLNSRTEIIAPPSANTTVLQLNIGPVGSADVQMGATGQLLLQGGFTTNINVGVGLSGGSPVPVSLTGSLAVTSTGMTLNVQDSVATDDLLLQAVVSGTAPITVTGNNGRLILDPRTAANAVTPNTFGGNLTISQGEVGVRSAGALGNTTGTTIVSGGSLLLDNSGAIAGEPLSIGGAGFANEGVIRNTTGNNSWTGNVTLTAAATVSVNTGTSLDFSGVIGESGSQALIKLMPGNLIFSGTSANTYTGTTTVNEGTLTLNKTAGTNAFGGALTVGNDAGAAGNFDTVQWNAANQVPDGVAITVQSTGRLNLGANLETLGAFTLVAGMLHAPIITSTGAGGVVMNGNVTLNALGGVPFTTQSPGATFAGSLNLNNATRTFTINDAGNGVMETVLDAAINSGGASGAITSNGAGLLVLTNNNTLYTGTTTVSAGSGIVVRNNGALGSGTLNYTAASNLFSTNYGAAPSTITISNPITLNADLTIRGDNNLILAGPITGQGAANRTLTLNVNNAASLNITGNLNLSNDGTARTFILNESTFNHISTLSGFIRNGSGATNHAFQKGGNGTLILSGNNNSAPNNDFIGTTTVAAGIVRVTHNNALGNTVAEAQTFAVTSTGGGSFTITYNGQTTGALNYTATTPPLASDVALALNALPSIARTGGVVSVASSNPAGPTTTYTVTFGGALSGIDVVQMASINVTAPVTVSTAIATTVAGAGGTVVNNGATLQAIPGLTVLEPLTLNNNGLGNLGALRLIDVTPGTSETLTWPGNINFNATAFLGVDGGGANPDRLILTGANVSGGGLTTKVGPGELEWAGNTDNAQVVFNGISAFDDGIDVRNGTVYFNKPANFNVLIGGAAVNVGDGGGGTDRLIIMGASNDHIAGTAPLTVGPSGLVTFTGAATTEAIPNTVNLQRWMNSAGTIDTSATRTLSLTNTVNVQNLGFTDGSTPAAQILGQLDLGTASRSFNVADSLVLNAAEDLVVSAVISSATAGSGVTKDGYGTMAITGANTYQGTTTVNAGTQLDGIFGRIGGVLVARNAGVLGTGNLTVQEGGTLTLNNTAASINRIADAAVLDVRGALNLIGNSAGTTEVVGATTINASNNGGQPARITVDSAAGGATELTLASLARGGTASAEFVGVGANLGSATNSRIQIVGGTSPFVNNVLPWATIRGPAGYDLVTDADGTAGTSPYFLGRVTTYNTNINSGGIVRITGGTQTLTANTTVDALLIEGGATINSANFDLIVGTATAGLIVSNGGTNAINLGATGEFTYAGREPLFLVEAGSTLTANGLVNSTANLRLDRGGTLVLSGDNDQGAGNQFTGSIEVGSGLLRSTHADALGSAASTGTVTIRNLATLSLEAPMSVTANRTLNVSGPGVNNNGALVVTSGNAVTWGNGTTTLAWNQTPGNLIPMIMNVAGTLSLEGTTNTANSQLIKIGAGTLSYSGTAANTNAAAVSVNEGTLILNKTGANTAVLGTLTIEDLGNFDPGTAGAIVNYGSASSTNNIADGVSVVINDQGQLNLAGASDIINALNVNGSRIGSDNLSTGVGTLQVNGAMTVTGGTINGNILLNNNLTYNSNSFGPGGRAIINGTLNLNNAQRTFSINDNYAVDDLLINAALSNGRLIKNGNGSLALTNSGNALQAGINEIQTLAIPGTVTAFTLTFNGATSQPISTISAAGIQTALDNLLGSGNALVTGAATPFTVEFISSLAGVDVAQFTSTVTGGSGTITHATTTAGVASFNLNVGILALANTTALGGGGVNISGNVGLRPVAGTALNLAARIVVNPNLTTVLGGRRDFGGTDAFTLSGPELVIVPSVGFNNNYQIDDPLINAQITGPIVGGARGVVNNNIPIVKTGFGKLILSGVNTFVGHVNVSQGILNVRDSMALGSGGLPQFGSPFGSFVSVNGLAALELEGGVTITDRTLVLAVANPPGIVVASGYQNNFTGALRSISGSNVWRGAVDLRGFDGTARSLFVGVDAGDLTIDGSIVGTNNGTSVVANNLVKIGAGSLIFGGDAPNSYGGSTAVLAGKLTLSKSPGVTSVAGTLVVGDNVGTGDIVEITSAEQVANAAQLQVQTSGQLVLNGVSAVAAPNEVQTITFSAAATAGTWSLNVPGAGAVPAVVVNAIPFNVTPSALEALIAQAQGSTNVRVGGVAGLVYTFTFSGGMGGQDIAPLTPNVSGITPGITAPVVETQIGGGANPIAAAETINTPLFVVGATSSGTVNVGNATLVFNGDATVTARPGITTAVPAQITGTGSVALLPANAAAAATRTITVNDAAGLIELSIVPTIVDRPGGLTGVAASITKAGPGRLSLGGANTFTGSVTIAAGSLRMQNVDALGDVPGIPTTTTVNSGAALEIDLTGSNAIDNENIITNGFGILNGPITPFFATILGTGALRNIAGTNTLNVSTGNILTLNADSSFQVDAGRLIVDGVIANTGGNRTLIKTGTGDLEMTGGTDNTYAGNTLVNEGKLVLNKSGVARAIGAPGSGELFIGDNVGGDNSDTVDIGALSGGDQIQDARPIHIARTGRFNFNTAGETLTGNIFLDVGPTISGDLVTGVGTLLMSASSILAINQAGITPTSPAATFQGNFDGVAGGRAFDVRQGPANVELDVQAILNNATSITKNGRGTMILSGNNTYTGGTTVNADSGTLLANTPAAVAASNFTINPGSVLGGTGTINGTVNAANVGNNLTVGGTINPGPTGPAPNNTGILIVNNNVTFGNRAELWIDVNGTVAGTGYDQLRVIGTGTVTISTTANNGSRLNGTTGLALLAGTGVKVIDKVSTGAISNEFANAISPSPPASVVLGTRSYSFNYADNSGGTLGNNNDLVLFSIPSTVVWDGRVDGGAVTASNNWTLAANWVGDAVPAPGDAVMFNDIGIGNGKNTPFNDFPAASQFGVITFANTSGSYNIGGNSITLALASGANIVSDNAMDIAVSNTFNVALITATSPQTITVKENSTLTLGAVTIVAAAPLTINNGAAGPDATGSIVFGGTVNGAATLTINLVGDATFSGAVGGVTPLTSIAITTADDVTFSSTVATTGNLIQAAGTNVTTLSSGTIGGTLTINNKAVVLAGSTLTVTGNTTLNATVSGVNQTAGALVTPALTLTGVGNFALPQAANDFNTLTVNVDGNVTIRDVDDLAIAGITTTADIISITAGATVTQSAPILGAALELKGAGSFTLLGANDVVTLAANVTEAISYNDLNALAIGTVNTTIGITTTADNVSLSAGGAVTQTAAIVAATLDLQGAGPFTLNLPGNDATTLTANTTNAVSYTDANNLAIGTLTATGAAVTLNVIAGAITDANAAANNITAAQLVANSTTGVGTAADPLETTITGGLEATGGSGGVFIANTGALTIGGVSVVVGVNASAGNISVTTTGLLTVAENVTTTGNVTLSGAGINFTGGTATSGAAGSVTLTGGTGAISTTTAALDVVAQDLFATATTGIDLDTTITNVTLANTGAGNVVIDETNALNLAGLNVGNGTATINALGALTNGVGSTLSVSGVASFAGTTIALGNQAGDNLSFGSLAFNSAGAVIIDLNNATALSGASTAASLLFNSTGAITNVAAASLNVAGAATLTAPSVSLGNQAGDAINFGTLTFTSAGAVNIAEDSSTSLVGANTAGSASITSTAALANTAGSSILVTGLGAFGGTTVNLGNLAGDTFNVGSLGFSSTGVVTITEDSATQLGGVSTAGSLVLTSPGAITNAAAASATVTGAATLSGTSIALGNQAGDAISLNTLTFTATTGSVVVEANSGLQLTGANTAPGAIALTTVDAVGFGENFVLPAGASLTSGTGAVAINAGDNATIGGNVTSALTTTINVDFGDAESPAVVEGAVGSGGQVIITGVITTPLVGSGGGTFLNGNDDFDTFTFSPQTTTEFRVDGGSPTGTPTGDSLQLDTSVATGASLIAPGTIAPYNGPGSGTWTFTSPHQQVLFTNIEDNSPPTPFHLTIDNSGIPIGNIVIMRDASQTRVQVRDGSNAGPIIFQGLLTAVLSVRVLGSSGPDMVTVDDINTLPDFLFSVPGVSDNPTLAGTGELLFDGMGGSDTLVFNLNGPSVAQTYAVGTGAAPGNQEGEVQTVGSAISLTTYFQNVELVQRIGSNAALGTSALNGDSTNNTIGVTANGALTRIAATGYVPYDVTNAALSQISVNGLIGTDTIELIGLGSGAGNPAVTLNGGNDTDTIRVHSTSGHTGAVTLNGNAGSDIFQVYSATNTVDSITASIIVDGSDGSVAGNDDKLFIVDSGDLTADSVQIGPVNAASSADYRVEGINGVAGDDVVFRNIDTLSYTGTQGNDLLDSTFVNTTPAHDLNFATVNGWLGADQFLLFVSDQIGGTAPTPTGLSSGLAAISLNGDAPGNPNAADGNDVFGQTAPGLVGTGSGSAGLAVPDTVRGIRPSVTTAIAINGGTPTGPAAPTGDTVGDVLNLDLSALPGNSPLILATVSGVVATTGIQPLSYGEIEDFNLILNNQLINVQMGDTLVRGTNNQDLIQFMRNPIPGDPEQTRVRLNALVADFTTTGKTLTFAGASNDYVTMANVTFPGEIYGEDGDDYISGAMGNDFLVGGLGNDQINASGGDNIVWGDNAASTADPNPQSSAIGGNDVLSALDGNDVFYGGGGNDQVSPGGGNDYIYGGEGNDLLDGHLGDDRIYGGGGDDVISGGAGNDLLVGGAGNDLLIGRDGNDVLIGGDGSDSLNGENGSDLLISGMVSNEASVWNSVANTTTFDAGTYVRPSDNDAALMLLLSQWANSSNKSALGTVIGDGDPDVVVTGPGDDQTFGST